MPVLEVDESFTASDLRLRDSGICACSKPILCRMTKWAIRAIAVAIAVVAVGVMRRRRTLAVPDARGVLDDMRRLADVRDMAWVGDPSPSAANDMLNASRFGLHQVQVLRDWEGWLDAQDATIKFEVDTAEREFVEYRRQALDAGAEPLPVDLPDDPE